MVDDDIKLDNKVCLFYIINELKDIITEPNVEDVEKRLTDFHNTLIFKQKYRKEIHSKSFSCIYS